MGHRKERKRAEGGGVAVSMSGSSDGELSTTSVVAGRVVSESLASGLGAVPAVRVGSDGTAGFS